jgi:hypothetical protein
VQNPWQQAQLLLMRYNPLKLQYLFATANVCCIAANRGPANLVKRVKSRNLIESVEIPTETRNAFENICEIARTGCLSDRMVKIGVGIAESAHFVCRCLG